MEDVGVLSVVLMFGSAGGKMDVGVSWHGACLGCSMAVVVISMLLATSSDDNVRYNFK
jgi:Fe-S cluster biogenesis protein NfuA